MVPSESVAILLSPFYRSGHLIPYGAVSITSPITSPRPGYPRLALALAAAACLLYLASELYVFSGLALPLDDSWIHLQFAHHVAAGDGLAYDSGRSASGGRWISGSTAPLWTAMVALTFLPPGGPLVWVKLLGIGCFLSTVLAADRLAAELGLRDGIRRLAGVLTATTHWLVWSALSGMEIVLFAALSLWGLVFHLRERRRPEAPPVSLAVLAASILARPEGCLLLALALADRLLRFTSTRQGVRARLIFSGSTFSTGLLAALIVALPTALFYRWVGGSFLPTTFAVKTTPMTDLIPSGRYLAAVLDVLFRSQPLMLLLAGAGVLRLIERLGDRRDHGLLPALWPVAMALGYAVLAAPTGPIVVGNFGRYYFPILPLVVVLGALGLEKAGRRLGPGLPRALLIAGLLAPQLWGLATGPPRYLQTLANVEDAGVAAGRWLGERLPPEALLAVQDIGAIKYHLPNRIVDLTGIVNPDILPFLKGSGPRIRSIGKSDSGAIYPRSSPTTWWSFPAPTPGSPAPRRASAKSTASRSLTTSPWRRRAGDFLHPLDPAPSAFAPAMTFEGTQ